MDAFFGQCNSKPAVADADVTLGFVVSWFHYLILAPNRQLGWLLKTVLLNINDAMMTLTIFAHTPILGLLYSAVNLMLIICFYPQLGLILVTSKRYYAVTW